MTGARVRKMTVFETAVSKRLKELPNGRRFGEQLKERNAKCPTKFTMLDDTLIQFRLICHPRTLILRFYDKEENNETDCKS